MKIDTSKLKKAVKKPDGGIVSQCPACNADGHDTTGNHLIVYPDGKFGCVTNPQDKDHNKEILNRVGVDAPESPTSRRVTVRPFKAPQPKTLMKVPRRSLQELAVKRGEDSEMEVKK